MNLNTNELEELNSLLADKKIDIPEFRRSVTASGNNYAWLQRNIAIRNPGISTRLKTLLGMKNKQVAPAAA